MKRQRSTYNQDMVARSNSINDLSPEQLTILEKNNKMVTLGTLISGVAHDMNNPLSYVSSNLFMLNSHIKGFAGLIQQIALIDEEVVGNAQYPENLRQKIHIEKLDIAADEATAIIAETADGIKHIHRLLHAIKLYSLASSAKPGSININQSITQVLTIVNSKFKHRIKLSLNFSDVPEIRCYENRIQQAILNLLVNAAEAIDGKGNITIDTEIENHEWVKISISDTGPGIPEEHIANIFQPFFTTKPPGENTGVGLTISRNIIHSHNGSIECRSQVGKGATFIVRLPLIITSPDHP